MSGPIEYSWIDYEDNKNERAELNTTKIFSHKIWTQWQYSVYNYFLSQNDRCGVPWACVIIKYTTITDDMKIRGLKIIFNSSLGVNLFTRDSRKFLNILKELIRGTDDETSIKLLKCLRKSMQELQAHYGGTS